MNKLKRISISSAAALLIIFFGLAYNAHLASSSVVPVLMYHSIDAYGDKTAPFITPDVFKKQMEFLARHKYKTITPDEVVDYIRKEKKMPRNVVAITADDGFEDFYTYAFPLLKKYGLKATVFMATDKIGAPGMLNWQQLREMSDSGLVTIGSHTRSHPWMPTISVDEDKLRDELMGSKEILEKGLDRSVDYICYPNGGFNDLVKEEAKRAGFKGGFTTNPVKRSAIDDIYAIRRIKMSSSSVHPLILWGKMSSYYAWYKERR